MTTEEARGTYMDYYSRKAQEPSLSSSHTLSIPLSVSLSLSPSVCLMCAAVVPCSVIAPSAKVTESSASITVGVRVRACVWVCVCVQTGSDASSPRLRHGTQLSSHAGQGEDKWSCASPATKALQLLTDVCVCVCARVFVYCYLLIGMSSNVVCVSLFSRIHNCT